MDNLCRRGFRFQVSTITSKVTKFIEASLQKLGLMRHARSVSASMQISATLKSTKAMAGPDAISPVLRGVLAFRSIEPALLGP